MKKIFIYFCMTVLSITSYSKSEKVNDKISALFPDKSEYDVLVTEIKSQAHNDAWLKLCKKDWNKSYLEYMQKVRKQKKWTQDQLAFIGAFHGAIMTRDASLSEITSKKCN